MSVVHEHLLWAWCGPFASPLSFREIQTMTGLASDAIADALNTADVEALTDERHGIVYRPADRFIRRVAFQYLQPFTEEVAFRVKDDTVIDDNVIVDLQPLIRHLA